VHRDHGTDHPLPKLGFFTSAANDVPRVTRQMSSQLTSTSGEALASRAHHVPAAAPADVAAPGGIERIDAEGAGDPIPTPSDLPLALKRVADAALATLGLLALAPLLAVIAVAIKLDSPGPIFYFSERVGRGGRRFQLYKFRTMHIHACRGERYGADRAEQLFDELMSDPARHAEFQSIHKLREDPRVTRLGGLLRRTSLDELPQLANVIRGHLSLVGPRPVIAYEVEKLALLAERKQQRITDKLAPVHPSGYWEFEWLRPGVTGYWQVTARSEVGFEERMRLDFVYTRNWSLKLDLLIVLRTLGALAGRGAY
jgi:lipopolysaccharide/colanic/teichoic acid biosynthesis glycosyltransferase